jgi:hypothetical protein
MLHTKNYSYNLFAPVTANLFAEWEMLVRIPRQNALYNVYSANEFAVTSANEFANASN